MPEWIDELEIPDWNFKGYIVRQQIIDTRGWTSELIDRFLIPDLVETNPHNHSQQMRLYLQSKVFTVEKSRRFKEVFLEEVGNKIDPLKIIMVKRELEKEKKQHRVNRGSATWRIKRKRFAITPEKINILTSMGLMPDVES